MVVVGITIVFCVAAAVMLKVVPGPHSARDYLVIGASATMVSMGALFVVLITGFVKTPNVFYKKRAKGNANHEG